MHPNTSPSRRTVLRTAAWSVPAVTLASAAPAFALSTDSPSIRAGVTNVGVLYRDVIGIHTKQVRTVLGVPVMGSSPELRITATNTGDVPLTGISHTVYLLANIEAALGVPPETATSGWTFIEMRQLVGADLDIINSTDFNLGATLGIGLAYDFLYPGTLMPGASTSLNFPLSPYDDGLGIVTALTNLLTGLTGMSYTRGMHEGSYEHNGERIDDAALLDPDFIPRIS